jgi:hypothetical protein
MALSRRTPSAQLGTSPTCRRRLYPLCSPLFPYFPVRSRIFLSAHILLPCDRANVEVAREGGPLLPPPPIPLPPSPLPTPFPSPPPLPSFTQVDQLAIGEKDRGRGDRKRPPLSLTTTKVDQLATALFSNIEHTRARTHTQTHTNTHTHIQ